MRPISFSEAKREAELIFERFTSRYVDDVDSNSFRIRPHPSEVGASVENKKNLFNKFRKPLNQKNSKKKRDKGGKNARLPENDVQNENMPVGLKRDPNRVSSSTSPYQASDSTLEKNSGLVFWIIPPPPPPPPPSYVEENNNLEFEEVSPGRAPAPAVAVIQNVPRPIQNFRGPMKKFSIKHNPHGPESSRMARLSVGRAKITHCIEQMDGPTNGDAHLLQVVDSEDDSDDIDGDGELFEDAPKDEQQKRIEEVSKMLDTIVEKEFGLNLSNSSNITRTSSSASISSLSQSLASDLSYSSFKSHLNNFIQNHNDTLIKQISLVFGVARSAMKRAGRGSSEEQEIKSNTMRFYEEQFVPQVSRAGGLDGLVQSSTDHS